MIALLGGSGYFGQAFQSLLRRRNHPFVCLSRRELDYTRYDRLVAFLRASRPSFVINAAGFTGKPNVDTCEVARAETLAGNVALPLTISHACESAGIPWAHVSSGCIYDGAKLVENGKIRFLKTLSDPAVAALIEKNRDTVRGFTESDEPNFTFRQPPCSFYSGSKGLVEELLATDPQVYIWRPRIPFDEWDNPRNYLTKLLRYPRLYQSYNSISHLNDFVAACIDLWSVRAPYGIYNVTNPGFIHTREVTEYIRRYIGPQHQFSFWENDAEFYRCAAKTPRSNCILDVSKLLATGVKIRPVHEALQDALEHWQAAPRPEQAAQLLVSVAAAK